MYNVFGITYMKIKFRQHKDIDLLYRVKWLNNPLVNKFIGNNPGKKTTLREQKKWFNEYKKNKNKKFFTICDNNIPIGFMGFSHIDKENRNTDIFIAIGEDNYRGKGIGKLATKYLVDYAFNNLKLHKVNLGVFKDNKRAINCYKLIGFTIGDCCRMLLSA